ncbi:MAG: carbamoyl-phosphate synthase small subunit [SAR116 cluster bacterium]|jgi:carbamoyl-phosphate synthase small subunit|nr:MAG: carbamoyl-phosphate synthase small subunit [SAR116 cluster bacterium]
MPSELNPAKNALLLLDNGTVFYGYGFGAETESVGELCFNTSMTGYQEIMTDPSYAGQIINFTFPHIGNVGTNPLDMETDKPSALGLVTRNQITSPSNWRSTQPFSKWLETHKLPGISGIDTRALTRQIRDEGAKTALLSYRKNGFFDLPAISAKTSDWPGLEGMDLAKLVTRPALANWSGSLFHFDFEPATGHNKSVQHKVVALDFGAKHNILRCLESAGCEVIVLPADSSADEVLAQKPDGVFLSNGPGDPAATAEYAGSEIRTLVETGIPIFGICIGHQLLALAMGGNTSKMDTGHRGANHPVKDLKTGQIEITSQNHGFVVNEASLPECLEVTHRSLFDSSVEGLRHKTLPVFSVQYHPESSPGPHDSRNLFYRFTSLMKSAGNS